MPHTSQDIFLKIAREKRLLDDEAIEVVLGLQKLDKMNGHTRSVEQLCVMERLLTVHQARGLMRAVRYYIVRQADRRYGRIALRHGFIARPAFGEALRRQKQAFHQRKLLIRISKILVDLGAITEEQDREVRVELVRGESSPRPSGRRRVSARGARLRSQRAAPARVSSRRRPAVSGF